MNKRNLVGSYQSMEHHKSNPPEADEIIQIATRKCLFRLLSFLDRKLPESCAVHSFVNAAILTASPSYRVYFKRQHVSSTPAVTLSEDEFSLIVGVGMERSISSSNQETKKCWFLSSWTDDDDKNLADAYETIDIIDWSLDAVVMHHKNHTPHPAISHFIATKQTIGHCYPCDQYVLSLENAVHLHIREIDGVYVKSLERCHAQTVYDYWPYKEGTTVENVAKEIEELPSAGVFLKDNNKLVSWMMSHPPNGMSRLHTLQEFRRRGYAALVTQYLSKRAAQCGFVPFVNIDQENVASQKFFENMKFKLFRPVHIGVAEPSEIIKSKLLKF